MYSSEKKNFESFINFSKVVRQSMNTALRVKVPSVFLRVVLGEKNILERNCFLRFFFFFKISNRLEIFQLANSKVRFTRKWLLFKLTFQLYFEYFISCSWISIERKGNIKIKSVEWSLIVEKWFEFTGICILNKSLWNKFKLSSISFKKKKKKERKKREMWLNLIKRELKYIKLGCLTEYFKDGN